MLSSFDNNVKIVGENIIINKGTISAIYLIPGFNYSVMSYQAISEHIEDLYNMFRSMFRETRSLKFCISKIDIPITKSETISYLENTMRKWTTEDLKYQEVIKRGNYSQFVLEVFLEEQTNSQALELKDIVKESYETVINAFSTTVNISNLDRLFEIEQNICNIITIDGGKRASRDIVFRYLLTQYFPGFGFPINLKDLPYNLLLKNVDNFYNYNLGYFTSQNEFLTSLGLKAIEKYNCILQYTDFPETIEPLDLNLNENCKIFISIGDQQKLKTKVKRKASDIEYSLEQNMKAGGSSEIDHDLEKQDLANLIIYRLGKGEIGCEASIVQMVTANSKEELMKAKKEIMVKMFEKDISCFSFMNQRDAFNQYYKTRRPQNYTFMTDLKYFLSTKIDNFTSVGDFDSKDGIGLSPIGTSV